jgi:hypothetical protein
MLSQYCYHPFYCEENIWHLCDEVAGDGDRVVFISNAVRYCSIWHMRIAQPGQPVHWDYHVVLLHRGAGGWEIWDLDTTLGLPVKASVYLEQSFRESLVPPRFRLVDVTKFRETFSSDRSHMALQGGEPKDPPSWPPITRGPNNLMRFIDMESAFLGEVLDLDGFRSRVV